MTDEYKMKLFDKWTETMDKEEFVTIGLQLFPKTTRKELEDNFEESLAGYRDTSAAAKATPMNIS